MSFAGIASAAAGAIVGGLMSDGEQQTASKEPWKDAAPWLRENIAQGQNLQAYYQQNPWNNLQQTAYQNTFSDIDQFRNSMAPGLMGFANRLMGQNYSRQGGQRPMQASPMQTKPMQGGLLQQQWPQQGPFSAPKGQSYGLLDFQALNPYNNALKPAEIKQPDQQTIEQAVQAELDRRQRESQYAGSAPYGGGG